MTDPVDTSDRLPASDRPAGGDVTDRTTSRRRTLVAAGSVLAAVSLAGCGGRDRQPEGAGGDDEVLDDATGDTDDNATDADDDAGNSDDDGASDSDDDGSDGESGDEPAPVSTVRAYFDAVDDGDLTRAKSHLATDSPLAEGLPDDPETFAERAENVTLELVDGSVVEMTEGEQATVDVTVEASAGSNSQQQPYRFELRSEDGEWRIWDLVEENDVSLPDVEGNPAAIVRAYLEGYTAGDRTRMEQTTHPDSPSRQSLDDTDQESLNELGAFIRDFRIQEITVVEQSEDRLVLDVTTVVAAFGETQTKEGQAELRTHEGEWRIWEEDMLSNTSEQG